MSALTNDIAPKSLRAWWTTPRRTGMSRLIAPYEYRHLRTYGGIRAAGGIFLLVVGFLCLYDDAVGWALLFLILGALNLGGGIWYFTIARSRSAYT